MKREYEKYMHIAIDQAKISLREGNNGFGAIIIKEQRIVAEAHDTEETEHDSTAHAEMNAIRKAARQLGKDLSGCVLITTHEPCPMCATAMIRANITTLVYGHSIDDALEQGRTRIGITCQEICARAESHIEIETGILWEGCAVLYNKEVRREIKKL